MLQRLFSTSGNIGGVDGTLWIAIDGPEVFYANRDRINDNATAGDFEFAIAEDLEEVNVRQSQPHAGGYASGNRLTSLASDMDFHRLVLEYQQLNH